MNRNRTATDVLAAWLVNMLLLTPGAAFCSVADAPLKDTLAAWHMADTCDAANGHPLQVRGPVTLGVPLDGEEAELSRQRAGDGRVARFEGGYLEIDVGDSAINMPGQAWTVAMRVRDPEGKWDYPLFGSYGGKEQVRYFLHAVDGATLPMADLHGVDKEVPTGDRLHLFVDQGRAVFRNLQVRPLLEHL